MTTLTSFINRYLAGRKARGEITQKTMEDMRCTLYSLDRAFGRRPIQRFGPATVDRWLELGGHMAPSTRRHRLSVARVFCRWLVEVKVVKVDATAHVPTIRQPRRVPTTLHHGEVARLLASQPSARAQAIIWLMVGCGCRCVEVARLATSDYDPDGLTLRLVGKGGHERVVPVPVEVAVALDRYLDETGRVAGPLIRSEANQRAGLDAGTISIYMTRWMAGAGIKTRRYDGRSAHGLRRTAASDVMDTSHDVRIVQHMLGHEHISSTALYIRPVTMASMREAMSGRAYHLADPTSAGHPQLDVAA